MRGTGGVAQDADALRGGVRWPGVEVASRGGIGELPCARSIKAFAFSKSITSWVAYP
jgi:hypothetical protein